MSKLNYEQEKARRRRQIEKGQLKQENGLEVSLDSLSPVSRSTQHKITHQ